MLDLSQLDLTYGNFESSVLVAGRKQIHQIRTAPFVGIVGDGDRGSIDLWLEIEDDASIPPEVTAFSRISATVISKTMHGSKRRLLELSVRDAALHRQFYYFAIAVAGKVMAGSVSPIAAVLSELTCFIELVEEKNVLSVERQAGLLGELLVLRRFVAKSGVRAIDVWHGPAGEPHDFRIGMDEYEVKTTLKPRRIHTISSAEQLVTSSDCHLYVISIMLGPGAGEGSFTLPRTVGHLTDLFAASSSDLKKFQNLLDASGYRSADSHHYTRSYALRRPIAVVPVNAGFPTVNRVILKNALGVQLATRVDHFQYDANLEGLELAEDSASFPASFRS